MKRSSCLAVLIGGLVLSTATAALAAPPTETEEEPVEEGVQGEPLAQQDGSGSPTAPSNAPAPEEGTSTSPQPAVSIGTSPSSTTPPPDKPAEPEPTPAAKPKPRPFAGSALFVQNNVSTGTIFRGQTQSYNPMVDSSFWFLPRYALNDAFQLRGRMIMSYEWTNSDTTTYRNEPMLSDTTLSLFYRKIPKLPLGINMMLALNAGLPTSKLSRARTMVVAPGATAQFVKPLPSVLGSDGGMLMGSLIYSHPLYSSRNPVVVDPRPAGAFTCVGGNGCSDLLSGTMNPSDTLSYAFLVVMEWGHWAPALYYLGGSQWAYSPRDVTNPVDGTPVGRPEGFEPTTVSQTHNFSAWLDYNINTWLTAEVGYINSTNAITASGQRANMLFNRYADSRVYLGASFQLDNLVKALQGGDQGEAGVVRAKNTKQPMWSF